MTTSRRYFALLRTSLQGAGYEVETADSAAAALTSAAAKPPDAVILDLVLPDGNGTEVCRELRGWTQAPILLLSAVGDEDEKVAALDAGADDYVTKPFGIEELLARLRAALRRVDIASEPVIDLGGLVIDLERRLVTLDERPIALTPTEYKLLELFVRNEGKLLTHPTISAKSGGRRIGRSPTISMCTSRSSGGRSNAIRPAQASFSPRPAPATASSAHLEPTLRPAQAILSRR